MPLLLSLLLACNDEEVSSPYGCGKGGTSNDTAPVFEVVDENIDNDGDGMTEAEGDCDDNNCNVYDGAPEYNWGIDSNCDGELAPLYGCGQTSYDLLAPPLLLWAILSRRRSARRSDGAPP